MIALRMPQRTHIDGHAAPHKSQCGKYLWPQRSFTWQLPSSRLAFEQICPHRGVAMQVFKSGFVAAMMVCALSATAQADCVKVGAVGEAVTHDIAYLFATHGLANVIYGQGRVGKGPVHTKCDDGSSMTTCHSSQMACKVTTPKTCLGAWLCFPT